jgi:hypothetical protein
MEEAEKTVTGYILRNIVQGNLNEGKFLGNKVKLVCEAEKSKIIRDY